MKLKTPFNIHNEFLIEVKDIETGEIQKGYAYNIILNNLFSSPLYMLAIGSNRVGHTLRFGSGTGALDASRTTLFSDKGYGILTEVETVYNQPPVASYTTREIIILPSEQIGTTITEVGIGDKTSSSTIYTHALIKDSEGNPLSLGPKTDTQQITIYSTVYLQADFEDGVKFWGTLPVSGDPKLINSFLKSALMLGDAGLFISSNNNSYDSEIYLNGSSVGFTYRSGFVKTGAVLTLSKTLALADFNGTKIKKIGFGSPYSSASAASFEFDLEILAQNESSIWGGHQFQDKLVGVGDGVTKIFNLTWDEALLTKTKKVYIDGVEKTSGVTWTNSTLTFDDAPLDTLNITADYWVDYLPKDNEHIVPIYIEVTFNEGTPT